MSTTQAATRERNHRTATFGRIVCGVNASRADAEAVRQAALLSGPEGSLELVCVLTIQGYGPTEQATIAPARAETAMEHALDIAKELGIKPRTRIEHAKSPWHTLAEASAGADLLVLGSRGGSRAGGVMLGSVATEATHRAETPVLVARPAPGTPFPERILLASDGLEPSRAAAELALRIARVHGSEITLFTAGDGGTAEQRHELAEQATTIATTTGREPIVVSSGAPARTAIVAHATAEKPSLVVLGSSGKLGVKALGSVSEHVMHHVPSSVLVARTHHNREETR
jgi:nucleotide-binding universal stress UspA family protein